MPDIIPSSVFGVSTGVDITPVNPLENFYNLPEYKTPSSGYTDTVFPFGSGKSSSSNPIGDGINSLFSKGSDWQKRSGPTYFNDEKVNSDRYKVSDDFLKLGVALDGSNEERYGQNQSWGEVLSNGFTGMRRLAANGFVDGWKGWGRLTDALLSWDWDKLKGDAQSMMELDQQLNTVMNENPIYATEEGDSTFWNRQTFGNFLQQSGFAVGAAAQMLTEQLLTKAIEAGLTLTVAGAPIAAELEAAEDLKTAAQAGRVARAIGKAKEFYDTAKNFRLMKKLGDVWKSESLVKNLGKAVSAVGRSIPLVDTGVDLFKGIKAGENAVDIAKIGLSGLKRNLSEANFAFTEARMEAAGTYSDLLSKMQQDYYDNRGTYPSASEMSKMESAAMQAADKNFNFNTAVLAVSNRIQFDNIFRNSKATTKLLSRFGIGERTADDVLKVVGKVGERDVTHYYEKGALGALGLRSKIASDFGKGVANREALKSIVSPLLRFEVTEGIQELLQEGSNEYFKDYYSNFYKATYDAGTTVNPTKSLGKAVDSQLTLQGLKTFASGALTGLILHGPTKLTGKGLTAISGKISDAQNTAGMTQEEKDKYFEDKKKAESAQQEHFDQFNAFAKSPSKFFNDSIKNFNTQKEGASALDEAAKAGDKLAYEDIREGMVASMVEASVRNNTYEGLIDTLTEYGRHFTKEEFEQAFVGEEYSSDTKKLASDYTSRVVSAIESYVQTRKELSEKFSDLTNVNKYKVGTKERQEEELKQVALESVLETIARNRFKFDSALNRMLEISSKQASNKNIGPSLQSAFNTLGSERNTQAEILLLKEEVKSRKDTLQNAADIPKEDRQQIGKEIEIRDKKIAALEDWISEDSKKRKQYRAFRNYVNAINREDGNEARVYNSDVVEAYSDMQDYLALSDRSQKHVDAVNFLTSPENFKKFWDRLHQGATAAYKEAVRDAVKQEVKNQATPVSNDSTTEAPSEKKKVKLPDGEEEDFDTSTSKEDLEGDFFSLDEPEAPESVKNQPKTGDQIFDLVATPENYAKWSLKGDGSDYQRFVDEIRHHLTSIDKISEATEVTEAPLERYLSNSKAFPKEIREQIIPLLIAKYADESEDSSQTQPLNQEQVDETPIVTEPPVETKKKEVEPTFDESQFTVPFMYIDGKTIVGKGETGKKSIFKLNPTTGEAILNRDGYAFGRSNYTVYMEPVFEKTFSTSDTSFDDIVVEKPALFDSNDRLISRGRLILKSEVKPTVEEDITEEDTAVPDYEQNTLGGQRTTLEDGAEAIREYQEGLKQVSPALSLANTTELIVEEDNGVRVRRMRGDVNPNYVKTVATQEFMPGKQVKFKVVPADSVPESKYTSENATPEDKVPIGVFSNISGEEKLIGHLHVPQWIEYTTSDGKHPNIVVEDENTIPNEVARLRQLRKLIVDNTNKNKDFVLLGTVSDKSIGIVRTVEDAGKISERVDPRVGDGGTDNRAGMFGIIRAGRIEVDRNIGRDDIVETRSFSDENDNLKNLEGVPVLLVPTPTGKYFPSFVQLPRLQDAEIDFIIEAWKAFTGQTNNPELVKAVYEATGRTMGENPNIRTLKAYINQYITMLNSKRLSQTNSRSGADVPVGAARLNISSNTGELFIQCKPNKNDWYNVSIAPGAAIPENLRDLMRNLMTGIKFTDRDNKELSGINSTNQVNFLSLSGGKVVKTPLTYNQYIMSKASTFLQKGIESENKNNDWIYFSNPVVKMEYTEPIADSPVEESVSSVPEPLDVINAVDSNDPFTQLMAAAAARGLSQSDIDEQKKICEG